MFIFQPLIDLHYVLEYIWYMSVCTVSDLTPWKYYFLVTGQREDSYQEEIISQRASDPAVTDLNMCVQSHLSCT